ncbi:DinB family protein [Gracilibacillus ureilyticus]|uniref:DinB family protein n=1 Tax=Gracilibacillus ureilyticus TaxID=531814 RepID=A0A1H9VV75_9BACI|nr:DinB family protein [Gracilibacillus ureilyticus]SES25700.1 DinB family protein [Gracilibacillus ureilyticus]
MEKTDYEWVKQTRKILLDQCKQLNENELTKEFGFGFHSIKDSLIHIAGCYHAWLGSFVLSGTSSPLLSKEEIRMMEIRDIEQYFQQADIYVDKVLEKSSDQWNEVMEKNLHGKLAERR